MYKNGTPMNKSDPIMNITEFVAKYNPQARKIVIKSKKYLSNNLFKESNACTS